MLALAIAPISHMATQAKSTLAPTMPAEAAPCAGGTGYRSVCDSTACHEYGCQGGSCGGKTEQDYLNQPRRSA